MTDRSHRPIETATQVWPKPHCWATIAAPASTSRIEAGRKTRIPRNSRFRPSLGRSVGSVERSTRRASSCEKNAPPTQMTAQTMWT